MENNNSENNAFESSIEKKPRRRNWPSIICLILAIPLIVFDLLMILPVSVPRAAGYQTFFITTGSMDPVIPTGSLAYFKSTDPASVKVGEVIAYLNNDGIIVVHRVKKNEPDKGYLFCKGDNNYFIDQDRILYENVLGIYGGFIPGVGKLMYFMHSPVGKILLAVIGASAGVLIVISIILHRQGKK